MRDKELFCGFQVNITIPNHKVSVQTIWYQYLLLNLLHASNENLTVLTVVL